MRTLALILASLALAGACGKNESESAPEPATVTTTTTTTTVKVDPHAKAKEIFAQRCTACHGPEGRGDGPASAGLTPKPRNFGDADWQKSVDDAHIQQIIKFGGSAVGKSPAMPGNPDLTDEAVVVALKDVVRGLGKN